MIAECDSATVLRDGTSVATLTPRESGVERIVAAMLGEEVAKAEVQR